MVGSHLFFELVSGDVKTVSVSYENISYLSLFLLSYFHGIRGKVYLFPCVINLYITF